MYLVNITNPLAVTTLKDSYAKRRDSSHSFHGVARNYAKA